MTYPKQLYPDDTRPIKAGDWMEIRMSLSAGKVIVIQPTGFAAKHGFGKPDKIELDLGRAKELHAKLTTFIEFHKMMDKIMPW